MLTGKYLSLPEAQKGGRIDQFAKEHPSTGDRNVFDDLLDAMAKKPPVTRPSSKRRDPGNDENGTRIPQDISSCAYVY